MSSLGGDSANVNMETNTKTRTRTSKKKKKRGRYAMLGCCYHALITTGCCVVSYQLGVLHALSACVDGTLSSSSLSSLSSNSARGPQAEAETESETESVSKSKSDSESSSTLSQLSAGEEDSVAAMATGSERFPKTLSGIGAGMARTSKSSFVSLYDFGNPNDSGKAPRDNDALVIYSKSNAFPSASDIGDEALSLISHEGGHGHDHDHDPGGQAGSAGSGIPLIPSASVATSNCHAMNVLLVDSPSAVPQCLVLLNNYQSYHVQRWMRVTEKSPVNASLPLRLVSRGYNSNGIRSYKSPRDEDVTEHWAMLKTFFNSLDEVLQELRPIAQKVASKPASAGSRANNNHNRNDNGTIVVMTCNFGQSELLANFACTARARGFDLSNVLVFPTDRETLDLALGLGLNAYYDGRNFESMPSKEAGRYGDKRFVAMMYAKVVCVQLIVMLGYDVLFQDVDMIWYRNPLDWFREHSDDGPTPGYPWDIYFQDDGAHTVRYAPFSANSGFYYVRNNDRTRYLFTSLLYAGDLIRRTESHQQTLIALLNEHSSLYGLRVKVLNRDMDEFPGGWNYHKKNKMYMKKVMKGEIVPYIFHMSWTTNKKNKLKFFQQMGEWRVADKCVGKKAEEILGAGVGAGIKSGEGQDASLVRPCCLAEPNFKCHYRDKPSLRPCKDSPPIDKGGRSFW